jgi:flavin-dependent dehydrogenase
LHSRPKSKGEGSNTNHSSKSVTVALRAYYEGVEGDSSRVDIFFDRRFFPGYAWVFPLGEGRANVGLGAVVDMNRRNQSNRIKLRECFTEWAESDPQARSRLSNAKLRGHIVGWPLNTYQATGGAPRSYARRVLLIGDAASLVDPINGEGIHTALESARIAARIAGEALLAGDFSATFLSRYERRWRSYCERDLRIADLYVTIARNRALAELWLSIVRIVGNTAREDRAYAQTLVGVLAGVLPARLTLSPIFLAKTLLHSPAFYRRVLDLPDRKALASLRDLFGVETAEWSKEVASKALGVLTSTIKQQRS